MYTVRDIESLLEVPASFITVMFHVGYLISLSSNQIKSNFFARTTYKRKTVKKKHKVNTKKSTTYRL